jgi:hypothetical protein
METWCCEQPVSSLEKYLIFEELSVSQTREILLAKREQSNVFKAIFIVFYAQHVSLFFQLG